MDSIKHSKLFIYSILLEIFLNYRLSYNTMDSIIKFVHFLIRRIHLPTVFKTIIEHLSKVGVNLHNFKYCESCKNFIFIDNKYSHCLLCFSNQRNNMYYVQNATYISLLAQYDLEFE